MAATHSVDELLSASWAFIDTASCYLVGYAIEPARPDDGQPEIFGVALEVCGTKTAVTELFRAARRGDAVQLVDGERGTRESWTIRRAASSYASLMVPLSNGAAHGLLVHPHATASGIKPEHAFFVIAPSTAAHSWIVDRFYDGLTNTTILPLLPAWATTLWDAGCDAGLIEPITTGGRLAAHRVCGETGQWASLVERLVRAGRLAMPEEMQ